MARRKGNTRQSGGFLFVGFHVRCKADSLRNAPEVRVVGPPNQLRQGRGMTVGRVQIPPVVINQPKGIHAAFGEQFSAGSVHPEPERASRPHLERVAIGSHHFGEIRKPVARLNPAIESPRQVIHHAVGVFILKWPQ